MSSLKRFGSPVLLLSLLLLLSQPSFCQSGSVKTGEVTYNWIYEQVGTCEISPGDMGPLYEWYYYDISVNLGGKTVGGNYSTGYLVSPGGSYCPSGPTNTLQIPVTNTDYYDASFIVYITPETGGQLGVTTAATEGFSPPYEIVSILYAPPGNQSSQAYSSALTNGTTTSTGKSFSESLDYSLTSQVLGALTGGGTWGQTTTGSTSSSFTTTWTNATNYFTDDNSNTYYNPPGNPTPDMINHNWDTFLIWLNPQPMVFGDGGIPSDWYQSVAPVPGFNGLAAWVIEVVAQDIEATPQGAPVTERNPNGAVGVTTVLLPQLEPIESGPSDEEYFLPGLAKICANQTLYQEQLAYDIANPTNPNPPSGPGAICTQANQCGCTPADFAQIVQTDLLIGYTSQTVNGVTTYTAHPYPGQTDPTTLDKSGGGPGGICEKNPIPKNSDCRYVMVPASPGATSPLIEPLSTEGGDTYTVTDQTISGFQTSASISTTEGDTWGIGLYFPLKITDTWTWTDTESTTNSNGVVDTMSVTLRTSSTTCGLESVNIYEDTIFHTFVFAVSDDWATVCP
jgi:hypothetical protein